MDPARAATADATAHIRAVRARVEQVIRNKPEVVELALVAVLAGGHLLLEDVPGVGKTTLAHAIAGALGGTFRRIQFTSDLLPGDVIGVSVLEPGGTFGEPDAALARDAAARLATLRRLPHRPRRVDRAAAGLATPEHVPGPEVQREIDVVAQHPNITPTDPGP